MKAKNTKNRKSSKKINFFWRFLLLRVFEKLLKYKLNSLSSRYVKNTSELQTSIHSNWFGIPFMIYSSSKSRNCKNGSFWEKGVPDRGEILSNFFLCQKFEELLWIFGENTLIIVIFWFKSQNRQSFMKKNDIFNAQT